MSSTVGEPSSVGTGQQRNDAVEQISASLKLPAAARSRNYGASWTDVCHKWGLEIVRERTVYVSRSSGDDVSATQEQFVVSVVRPHGSASDLADRSPARRAGLKVGDVVVSLAGKGNLSPKDLYMLLKDTSDELQICVQRQKNGQEMGQFKVKSSSNEKKTTTAASATSEASTQRERVAVQIPKAELIEATAVGDADVKSDPINQPLHETQHASAPTAGASPTRASSPLADPADAQKALKAAPDVGPGWKIFEVERKGDIKTKGRVDRYWISPSGKRFRSGKEIERYQETLRATNGDENAAWLAAKPPPSRTKKTSGASGAPGASAIGATTNAATSTNARISPELLRLVDMYEDWDTTGNRKAPVLKGYIYNCKGGKSIRIDPANIIDIAEILIENRRNSQINETDPDQIVAEANRQCMEATEEEASFLRSLLDEISQANVAAKPTSSPAAAQPKAEDKDEINIAEKEKSACTKESDGVEMGGQTMETNMIVKETPTRQSNQPSIKASSAAEEKTAPVSPEVAETPLIVADAVSAISTAAEGRPRSSSNSGAKAKPKSVTSSMSVGIAYGTKKTGSSKSSRQKRLWPDSFIFRKRVMKWCPPDVVKQAGGPVRFLGPLRPQARTGAVSEAGGGASSSQSAQSNSIVLSPIPSNIHTVAEMIKVMSPHILEEGRSQVNRDYEENSDAENLWTRPTFEATLVTCTPVERKSSSTSVQRVYEFGFQLSEEDLSRIQSSIDDLFIIHSGKWDSIACIGMVGPRDEYTTTYLNDQRHLDGPQASFRLWITASKNPCDGTGWLAQSDIPRVVPGGGIESQKAYVMYIGSASDIMRQYEGMKSLGFVKDHLQRAIFCTGGDNGKKKNRATSVDSLGSAGMESSSAAPTATKPATIPDYVWQKICASLNQVQLRSIHRIMEGKTRENVALLQGPPGTGKTSTICHLVSALLNGACPKLGTKMAGVRVHIGKSIMTASSKGDKSTKALNRAANRILVCAASNAAVDELAWKIHKHSIAGDGRSGVTKIIRYGFLPWERAGTKGDPQLLRNSGSERDRFLAKINYDVTNGPHRKLLSDCDVVCATLSGLGSKGFIDAVSRDESNTSSEFDAIIIDEACQATEAACLIPLKYNPHLLVLVGDPQQLPAFVASQECEKNMFGRSLFERLQEQGWGVDMLHIQYRMHESIVDFPSIFYRNRLTTSDAVKNRPPARWHNHRCFPPLLVWNLEQPMQRGAIGGLSNRSEANFICNKVIREFINSFGASSPKPIRIGIISFYSNQVKLIKQLLPKGKKGNISFEVSTVDGFQGRETDIVIISCVRSFDANRRAKFGNLGFLQDFRRVNVALTRARESLWIVGNCNFLAKDSIWKAMLDSAANRKLIAASHEFDRLAPPSPRNNYNNNGNPNNGQGRAKSKKRGSRGAKRSPGRNKNSSAKRRKVDK